MPDPLIRRALTATVALWCAFLLATWLPTYLTWPWSNDYDHFAMMAQLWDAGGKPYRDIFSFQFPGELYLFRMLGWAFGPNNTVAYYAYDAALVVAFGGLLVVWGRRLTGSFLPGLIGFSAFLLFYVSVTALIAGQRDWHATFPALCAVLLPGVIAGRPGRVLSAVAFGVALTIRPQVGVLLPAALIAVDTSIRSDGGSWTRSVGAVVSWVLLAVLVTASGFVPLVQAGILKNFLANLKTMSDSPYNSVGVAGVLTRLSPLHWPIALPVAFILVVLLWGRAPMNIRGAGRVALAAMLGASVYHAISPTVLPYHIIPQVAAASVGACFVATQVLWSSPPDRRTCALLMLLFLYFGARERPRSFQALSRRSPTYTIAAALRSLRTGKMPTKPPLGYYAHQPWSDRRDLIEYLRARTTPQTPIANLLINHTSAIAGEVPRPSALPVDSGLLLMADIPSLALRDMKAIEESPTCVVVWEPSDPIGEAKMGEALRPLFDTVRRLYEVQARFGTFEVWRRKPAVSP